MGANNSFGRSAALRLRKLAAELAGGTASATAPIALLLVCQACDLPRGAATGPGAPGPCRCGRYAILPPAGFRCSLESRGDLAVGTAGDTPTFAEFVTPRAVPTGTRPSRAHAFLWRKLSEIDARADKIAGTHRHRYRWVHFGSNWLLCDEPRAAGGCQTVSGLLLVGRTYGLVRVGVKAPHNPLADRSISRLLSSVRAAE